MSEAVKSSNARNSLREKIDRRKNELSERENSFLCGKRVLFAEDDMTNAHLMMRILSAKGIKAEFAKDGNAAMQMFAGSEEHYYDAVILDVHMPVVNGHEAAFAIRSMRRADSRTVPIIAVTAYEAAEEKELSCEAGISVHLTKPVDPYLLYTTLEELLPRS